MCKGPRIRKTSLELAQLNPPLSWLFDLGKILPHAMRFWSHNLLVRSFNPALNFYSTLKFFNSRSRLRIMWFSMGHFFIAYNSLDVQVMHLLWLKNHYPKSWILLWWIITYCVTTVDKKRHICWNSYINYVKKQHKKECYLSILHKIVLQSWSENVSQLLFRTCF